MRLHFWNEQLARDGDTALARARAGAAFLDRKLGPGWDLLIDVERLDIASFRCVLGQLGWHGKTVLMTPWRAIDYGISLGLYTELLTLTVRPPSLVRSYELLTAAWKAVLLERRKALAEDRQPAEVAAAV